MASPPAPIPRRPIPDYLASVESLLRQIIGAGKFELSFSVHKSDAEPPEFEAPEFIVDFAGPDADLLLEKNGAVLDALEHVVLKAVRLEEDLFGKIAFDCEDWRRLRAEELTMIAQMAAERVLETGEPFAMNPMTPRERRIVHLALRDQANVRTASEGRGSDRRVVIHPASPPARPR